MTAARSAGAPTPGRERARRFGLRPFRTWTLRSRVVLVVVSMLDTSCRIEGRSSRFRNRARARFRLISPSAAPSV